MGRQKNDFFLCYHICFAIRSHLVLIPSRKNNDVISDYYSNTYCHVSVSL